MTTPTTTPLAVGQKVLCRIGYDWIPGVIVSVQEHLHAATDLLLPLAGAPLQFIQRGGNDDDDNDDDDESSINEEDFPRLQVGDVVPYRVVLETPEEGIVMPGGAAGDNNNNNNSEPQRIASIAANGKWFIHKLSGFKIILHAGQGHMQEEVWKTALTHWLNEEFTSSEEQGMKKAKRLLKFCANMRFLAGAAFIASLKSIPLHPLGHALWQCFVSGNPAVRITALPETLLRVTTMSKWLHDKCGIKDSHLAKHYADDTKSRHAEHVAAINGDVVMLCWLLETKYTYCRWPSDRPKPRNERVLRELLVVTADKETNNHPSLPRDDDGWTPLHHAAACGNFTIIDAYRIKSEERGRSWFNTWFPGVDEFQAKTLNDQTALDLASDDHTLESLLKLEKSIYQGILNGAIRTGRLPAGMAEFAELESLVTKYGLGINEANIVAEDDPDYRDGMAIALESGNPVQVQFLARLLDLKDLKTWRNKNGKGMLHVAAGRTASWQSRVRNDDLALRDRVESQTRRHAENQRAKLLFIQHKWNHGTAIYSEAKQYSEEQLSGNFRPILEEYETQCQITSGMESKIQLLQWLIQQGFSLPEHSFIIHNCDFPIAKFLLEYRMKTDSFINEQFEDNAPLAMVGVKQFLYHDTQDACLTASDVALLCAQRPAYDERLCITDAGRLLLLDCLDSNGYVDLVKIRTPSGDSILHEAVCNKETVIAIWLARKFPQLAHTRSTTSGQLPVHVALERVADQDDFVEKAICQFMIHYVGEGRGRGACHMDKRAWALEDSNGRTVKDYATSCCVKEIRREALKSWQQIASQQMLEMALDVASSVQSFESHVERNNLEDFTLGEYDEIRFIYSCISVGRFDVLQWYEQAFYNDGDSPLLQGLGRHISSERRDNKWLPRVFCSPSDKFSVGDCLEVLGRCRRKQGVDLDGSWMLYGWDLYSNQTHAVKIENGVCRTELLSLDGATLRECDSANTHGSMRLLLHANDESEYWSSTHVNQSIEGAVGMICLKREAARNQFWVDNGREIVLIKVEDATGDASESFTWQRARVLASNNHDLTIEFPDADPPIQEMIAQDSSRINRTGSYKMDYFCGSCAWLNFSEPRNDFLRPSSDEALSVLMTGLDLAQRYGHENIVQWIQEGASRATLASNLFAAEREFLKQFFSNASSQDMNQVIQEATMTASPVDLSDKGALVVSHLQDELYVLGHCWVSQKRVSYYGDAGGYDCNVHNKLGLFRCAARLGRLDRVEWLIGHGFDPNSAVTTSALFDAAYGNHVPVMQALLSKGVDATRSHAFSELGGDDGPDRLDRRDCTILELAVRRLSGDAVSFLIGQGHLPSNQSLLSSAVRCVFLHPFETSMKNRMAADRLSILQQLVSAGLAFAESATEIIWEALHSLHFNLREEKRPSSELSPLSHFVPITRELICWLCAQGCDLAFAVKRDLVLSGGEVPVILADLVHLSETAWPVAHAISHGKPIDEVEHLVQQSGTSIHAIRDPLGRTLVQVAVLSDQARHLEWLVTTKGVNIMDDEQQDLEYELTILELARQNGLQNMVSTITRLRQLQPH